MTIVHRQYAENMASLQKINSGRMTVRKREFAFSRRVRFDFQNHTSLPPKGTMKPLSGARDYQVRGYRALLWESIAECAEKTCVLPCARAALVIVRVH